MRYCCWHSAETSQVPTLPSHHAWVAIHSTVLTSFMGDLPTTVLVKSVDIEDIFS